MLRYIIAAVLGCIYVAGSILIVQREGHAYRDSLSKTNLAARETEESSLRVPEVKDKAVPNAAVPKFTSSPPKPATAKPVQVTIEDTSAEPAAKPAPPAR